MVTFLVIGGAGSAVTVEPPSARLVVVSQILVTRPDAFAGMEELPPPGRQRLQRGRTDQRDDRRHAGIQRVGKAALNALTRLMAWAVLLADGGPSGGFHRDGRPLSW